MSIFLGSFELDVNNCSLVGIYSSPKDSYGFRSFRFSIYRYDYDTYFLYGRGGAETPFMVVEEHVCSNGYALVLFNRTQYSSLCYAIMHHLEPFVSVSKVLSDIINSHDTTSLFSLSPLFYDSFVDVLEV